MRAGLLRHRVTIQQTSDPENQWGEVTGGWTTFAQVSARVQPLRGEELVKAQQREATVTDRVQMRYQDGVKPKMRILFGTRVLGILSVINVAERNFQLELLCREVVS